MLSLYSRTWLPLPSAISLHRNPRIVRRIPIIIRALSSSQDGGLEAYSGRRGNYAGVRLEEIVEVSSGKLRLDSWISSRINGISRARVQSSIRSGLVSVNGRVIDKVSHMVRYGDKVNCTISELQPLKAEGEDIALDIVYEDEHLLVVNKPAHMVVHPAPGNATGTLVNGILHHCSLPTPSFSKEEELSDSEDVSDSDLCSSPVIQSDLDGFCSGSSEASVRPGIVHRLDKGTSGLLVVAKDEHSHAHLSEQFKQHTIQRVYVSLTCGVPSPFSGRVDISIGRDLTNRLRMTADTGPTKCGKSRHAASRYRVIEILAGGGTALVEWKLETGRTHQIRAHAKYLGIPLLGDEVYGGTKNMALSRLQPKTSPTLHGELMQLVSKLDRPCLHALTLGFTHPHTGDKMRFSCLPPADFAEILTGLRAISTEKGHPKRGDRVLGMGDYERQCPSTSTGRRPNVFPPMYHDPRVDTLQAELAEERRETAEARAKLVEALEAQTHMQEALAAQVQMQEENDRRHAETDKKFAMLMACMDQGNFQPPP